MTTPPIRRSSLGDLKRRLEAGRPQSHDDDAGVGIAKTPPERPTRRRLGDNLPTPEPRSESNATGPDRRASSGRTHKLRLGPIKDESWGELEAYLGITRAKAAAHFEYGEFATIEIELDADLRIVGGRVVPLAELERPRR